MSYDHDPLFEGWDQLDWRQRRERRFQRWLSARRVGFVSDSAKQGPAAPGVPRQMMACSMAMTAAAVRFGASSLARMLPT